MDLTVLERQKARLTCLQQQDYAYSVPQLHDLIGNDNYSVNGDIVDWSKRPEQYQGMSNLSKFGNLSIAGTEFVANMMDSLTGSFEMDNCLSRTSSCQVAAVGAAMIKEVAGMEKEGEGVTLMESTSERNNLSKRKVEFVVAEECKDKRIKGEVEKETKVKERSSTENSAETSKENSKASEIKKADFIHVRARRGQATDSHSLAERARREKISKKMKCLQDLVPGCNKITGKAGMLDEIINYVQSLQRQVEFLSMKLAAQNPRLEFNIDNLSATEFPAYVASFPTATISSAMANLPYLQLNPVQQVATGCGLDMPMHPSQTATQENTSSSVSVPELCQVQPFSAWDADLQSLYNANNMGFH